MSRRAMAAGLIVIRVWREEGSTTPLRAQVRYLSDVSAGVEVTRSFTKVDDVVDVVRAWLTELAAPP